MHMYIGVRDSGYAKLLFRVLQSTCMSAACLTRSYSSAEQSGGGKHQLDKNYRGSAPFIKSTNVTVTNF